MGQSMEEDDDYEDDDYEKQESFDAEYSVYLLKMASVALGLSAIGCTGCGIWTMSYAAPKLVWPFASGSGVWTGVFTLATCLVGIGTTFRYNVNNPSRTKKGMIAFYTLVIINISISILHVTFSTLGLSYCYDEITIGEIYCNRQDRSRLMYISGLDMGFGIFIFTISFIVTIYISIGRKLLVLTGTLEDPNVHRRRCFGKLVCCSDVI